MKGKTISIKNQKPVILVSKQKLIQIHKVHDKCRDFNAERESRKLLNTVGGLKLRSYLLDFDNKYIWALSNDVLERDYNLKQAAYNSGIKELIETGYLVQGAIDTGYEIIDNAQTYHFYESLELKEKKPEATKPIINNQTNGNGRAWRVY